MSRILFTQARGGPTPRIENELVLAGAGGFTGGDRFWDVLFFGDMTSAGVGVAGEISGPHTLDDIILLAGDGSPLACQAATYYHYNNPKSGRPRGAMYVLPVAEVALSTAASQTLTFATTSTAAGEWLFAIGGHEVRFYAYKGMTADDQAAAFKAAFDVLPLHKRPPVKMTVAGAVVTITGTVKGEYLNDIQLRNILTPQITTTAVFTGATMGDAGGTPGVGTQAAQLTAELAELAGFSKAANICTPWSDATTLREVLTQLNTDANATNQIPRYLITGMDSDVTDSLTWQASMDTADDAERVLGNVCAGTDTWAGELAATALATLCSEEHLGRSLDGLEAENLWAPSTTDKFDDDELDTLLNNGLTPWYVHDGRSQVGIARAVMVRSKDGPQDFHQIRCADWVRLAARDLYRERLDRASIVADDAVSPDVSYVVTPAAVKSLLREVLDEAERRAYLTTVAELWELFENEWTPGSTELRQSQVIKAVDQLHNLMTKFPLRLG